jgi:hypothetical protein
VRGQLSLPALAFAFLVLTAVVVLGVAVADGALVSAERDPVERQATVTLSDRLVSADGPLTVRPNVFEEAELTALNETTLRTAYGLGVDADAEISLDGTTLVSTGDVDGDHSIERLVVVRESHSHTLWPAFLTGRTVTLPRRTNRVRLAIRPASNTTVTTVRTSDRVVLHNDSGLHGTFTVHPSRHRTASLSFDSNGTLSQGDVRLTYYPVETRKAQLEVTVDA